MIMDGLANIKSINFKLSTSESSGLRTGSDKDKLQDKNYKENSNF
jgi:hypothetical protein